MVIYLNKLIREGLTPTPNLVLFFNSNKKKNKDRVKSLSYISYIFNNCPHILSYVWV